MQGADSHASTGVSLATRTQAPAIIHLNEMFAALTGPDAKQHTRVWDIQRARERSLSLNHSKSITLRGALFAGGQADLISNSNK